MKIEDRVIPARFLVTLGHLVGVILISKTKSDNVYAGLSSDPTAAEVATANGHVNAALALAMVCFGLDFMSLFFGLSIFMMKRQHDRYQVTPAVSRARARQAVAGGAARGLPGALALLSMEEDIAASLAVHPLQRVVGTHGEWKNEK
ncbi:conserved unknown protein [Ectocarpus siliculosus]|uniref:Transmembrane protein 107 n=1 Tax=Ectocarpus siliculosus TaxID=2880 RepID=D8LNF7_ECTSI|nr:conserved unknown protein [Ectocarpus siliculosus]|eukprot:CBN77314.1 conserved unknown protein [Ectocarpus siliculosus]